MKAFYLNKNNNEKLLVFFAGWSFDENPFKKQDFSDFDVLIVYDYNDLSIPKEFEDFKNYREKNLLAWSMGVFCAYLLKDIFADFDKKIAINGTIFPIDDKYGIPEKVFKLTLIHAKKGLEGKFYQNLFNNENDFQKYLQNSVERDIENRVNELNNLNNLIKSSTINYEYFYDKAIVSKQDKIIPPQNQINSHKNLKIQVVEIDSGHFPFYQYNLVQEILTCQ